MSTNQTPSSEGARQRNRRDFQSSDEAVPYAVRLAASWSWRVLMIAAAAALIGYVLIQLRLVAIPAVLALLFSALLVPIANGLERIGVRRGIGAGLTLLLAILVVAGLLSLVGQQIASGFDDLADNALAGVDQVRTWLVSGPLHLSDQQINEWTDQGLDTAKNFLQEREGDLTSGLLSATSTLGHVASGLLLALFATFFFLHQGERIWAWTVRLFPRISRDRVDGAGRRAWESLTNFVRATMLVALVDAVGIGLVAFFLGVPLVVPIAVLVFLTAFIPIVGAVLSGVVAVLVALVAVGPIKALIMLIGVILVQQLESHALQPFLMGRLVQLHPLAIVFAVASGGFLAGIPGTLFAVPLVATVNAIVTYLASRANADEDDGGGATDGLGGGSDGDPGASPDGESGDAGPEDDSEGSAKTDDANPETAAGSSFGDR